MRSIKLEEIKEGQIVFYKDKRTYIYTVGKLTNGKIYIHINNQLYTANDSEGKFNNRIFHHIFSDDSQLNTVWKHYSELMIYFQIPQ